MPNPPHLPDSGPPGRPLTASDAELQPLVQRLEDFLAGYLELGERIGLDPAPEAVLAVVERALAQAEGTLWAGAEVAEEAERQYLQSLFEELNQERDGLYDRWVDARGTERFAPLADPTWCRVLRLLQARMARWLDAE
jgi:hypothetical protein